MITKEESPLAWELRQRRAHFPTETSPEELQEIIRKYEEKSRVETEKYLKLRQEEEERRQIEARKSFLEFQEMMKDVPYPEDDPEEEERERREQEEYDKGVPMYDWGARQQSNEYEIKKKYGWRIAEVIWDCDYHAERVPTKVVHQMHLIHEGKVPRPGKKPLQVVQPAKAAKAEKTSKVKWDELGKGKNLSPKTFSNGQFSTVKAGFINMARGNKDLQNSTTLLFYLLQHTTWEGKKDKHETYNTWYLKRKLIVASVGRDKMCADLGIKERTIRNLTNKLQKGGMIKVVKEGKENIYVLGEVIDGKELLYYSGEITWKRKPGSVH